MPDNQEQIIWPDPVPQIPEGHFKFLEYLRAMELGALGLYALEPLHRTATSTNREHPEPVEKIVLNLGRKLKL